MRKELGEVVRHLGTLSQSINDLDRSCYCYVKLDYISLVGFQNISRLILQIFCYLGLKSIAMH